MAHPRRMSTVESQRIIAILDETLEKLTFLGSITPDVLQHRDELSQFVGDEISRIIQEQRNLEERYEELIAQRGALKGLANKSKYKENQCEIQEVSRALRESTKNLCRNLKDNPNIGENLLKIQTERTKLQELLSATIREIQEHGTFTTLIDQVERDKRAQQEVADIVRREKETSAAVRQLDLDLARERQEHQHEVAQKRAEITALKEKLQQIKTKTAIDTKYARREARAKTASLLRTYQQEASETDNTISQLKKKRHMEEVVHTQTMEFLKRKQEQLVEECSQWRNKYTQEYEAKEAELARLTEERNKNNDKLQQLRNRYRKEKAERQAKEAEEERLKELEALRKQEEERNKEAAEKIQKAYRDHLVFTAEKRRLEEANRKGKKKGKKGKKGKKK